MSTNSEFEKLFEAETPNLFRHALLLSHDWYFAQDLVQETAEIMLKQWRKVRKADNPAAYAQTILTNNYLNHVRKRSFSEEPTQVIVPETINPWPSAETEIYLANVLSKVSPIERAVLIARYLDDLPVSQVAKNFGHDQSWVRVTAHRAMKKIREHSTPQDAGFGGADSDEEVKEVGDV